MTETFGPEYVRPHNPPCPACGCCTAGELVRVEGDR